MAMRRGTRSEQSAAMLKRNAACKSSSSSSTQRFKTCGCSDKVILYTARSLRNYGRLFWRCPYWKYPRTCKYFQWVDEDEEDKGGIDSVGIEAEVEAVAIEDLKMEELKRKNMKLHAKLASERMKGKILMGVIAFTWLMYAISGLSCLMKCNG